MQVVYGVVLDAGHAIDIGVSRLLFLTSSYLYKILILFHLLSGI